ncbi:MAG: hypothetical protein AAB657_02085 [Patescibacteria group bacterium]
MVFSPAKWAAASSNNYLPRSRYRGLVVFSALGLSIITYLVIIGSISTTGYEIRSLEKTAASLRAEAERLQVESAKLQALNQYENKAQVVGFVVVDKIEYLSASATVSDVAVR